MTDYLVSLLMGLAVGVAYGLVQARFPAPPLIALVGLLGVALGEQIIDIVSHHSALLPAQTSFGSFLMAQVGPARLPAKAAIDDRENGPFRSPSRCRSWRVYRRTRRREFISRRQLHGRIGQAIARRSERRSSSKRESTGEIFR